MKRYILMLTVSLPFLLAAVNAHHQSQDTKQQQHPQKKINAPESPENIPTLWQSIVQAFKNHY